MTLLEIASFTPESAVTAWRAGADRIELCEDREAGGTTPTFESLVQVKEQVPIPVFVMIRARGGDFNFSTDEFDRMKADIDTFKSTADGFVLGVLDEDQRVDVERTKVLVDRASPLPCTFHRAFDEARKQTEALEDIIICGCRSILSSGGASDAMNGAAALRQLVTQAGDRIEIIAGGGVRAKNLARLYTVTRAHGFHSSGILPAGVEADSMEIRRMKALMREFPSERIGNTDEMHEEAEQTHEDEQDTVRLHHAGLVAAVSAGTNTPIEEINRHL